MASKQRKVLQFIARKNGRVKRAELHASKVLDGGAKDYDYVCESLEDAGKIVIHKPDEEKRGTWYYTLVTKYSE